MFFFYAGTLFELCAFLEIIPYLEESCSIDQNPHWNIFLTNFLLREMKSWTEIRLSSLDFCINLNYTTLTSDIKK